MGRESKWRFREREGRGCIERVRLKASGPDPGAPRWGIKQTFVYEQLFGPIPVGQILKGNRWHRY